MTCLICRKRPTRLSGRATTCRLCDRGAERTARKSRQEKTSQYRVVLARRAA